MPTIGKLSFNLRMATGLGEEKFYLNRWNSAPELTLCRTLIHIYIYIYIYMCVCVCVCVCLCVCVCVC